MNLTIYEILIKSVGWNMTNNDFDNEIDGLLSDDNLFKPITEGLGFHHSLKNKNEIKTTLVQKSLELKEDLNARAKELSGRSTQVASNPVQMGELAPFYGKIEENPLVLQIEESIATFNLAPMSRRFVAWMLDLAVILSILSVVFIGTLISSGIPLGYVRVNLFELEFAFSATVMFLCFYVFYFSFFDKTKYSTPGKHLLGLQVVDLNKKPITFIASMTRSLITIVSFLTLGLASILKIQDKLTDTDVIVYE
jgi:uncharacterized RDD family membrane protein YckC